MVSLSCFFLIVTSNAKLFFLICRHLRRQTQSMMEELIKKSGAIWFFVIPLCWRTWLSSTSSKICFFFVYTLYIFNSLALFVPVFYLHLGTILNSLNLMLDTLSFHLDSCNGNVYCCSWTKMVGFGFPFQILFAIAMSCKGKNVTERDACLKCVNQASSN
jgi:apolipoprotein N-acyltransferase